MTLTELPHALRNEEKKEGKNNKLFISVKISRKKNITAYEYTKCISFWFETQVFLEWNTP